MTSLSLQMVIFIILLALVGVGWLAVTADRRRFRDPLLLRSGAEPEQLAALFESAPLGVLLLDLERRPVYANAAARRLLPALEAGEGEAWPPELAEDLTAVRAQPSPQPQHRVLTLSSDRTVSWWICPLPRFTLLFLIDLSRQRRLQKASQTFLSTVSHELRTPLTAVLAHLDIVEGEDVDAATRERSLAIVRGELQRLARLVGDMVQLGRLEMNETVEKRPVDLFLVAETAVAEVILIAEEKGIDISLQARAGLPPVPGDADKLKQAFLNVLDNSIKYGRAGDAVAVSLTPESGGVRVAIADTGPGIPPQHLPHVTERLYRGRREGEGSGLGLAIAAEILRLHQAHLDIESPSPNREGGVTVSFLLPAYDPGESRAPAP